MSAKVGPIFTFSLSGVRSVRPSCPLSVTPLLKNHPKCQTQTLRRPDGEFSAFEKSHLHFFWSLAMTHA